MASPTTSPSTATPRRDCWLMILLTGENLRWTVATAQFTPASAVQSRPARSRVAGSPDESFLATAAGPSTRGGSTAHPEGIAAQHTT